MWGKTFSVKSVFPHTPFTKVLSTGGGGEQRKYADFVGKFYIRIKNFNTQNYNLKFVLLRRITVRCLFPLYEVALLRLSLQQQIAHLWLFPPLIRRFAPPSPRGRRLFIVIFTHHSPPIAELTPNG